jgi:DNA-binding NarL/FixJ family response regulator
MPGEDLPTLTKPVFLAVDDHEVVLAGSTQELHKNFSQATIITASTATEALQKVRAFQPDLVLLDLSIPPEEGGAAQTEVGLSLLKQLMAEYRALNFTVQSSYIQRLITIVSSIERHEGGFTVADKTLSANAMVTRVQWSLQGITHTKDIKGFRAGVELRPEWMQVLKLAFETGLQDKAIAERMSISPRTVRLYMNKLQDALGIYPEDYGGQLNLRIQTSLAARRMGLIEDVIRND